jgi:redox-sensitive bicupin YhaK (pirin superfamily)
MTAGSGLQHAEMFPLLNRDESNPLELFQVWLNLPASRKMCRPYYKMLWAEDIPVIGISDNRGRQSRIRLIAGVADETRAVPPAPDSWAADPENEVAIWLVTMESGASFELPPASANLSRTIYFYRGSSLEAGGNNLPEYHSADLSPDAKTTLVNGPGEGRFLLLQGKPIHEPVSQAGPFVMNTENEIREAFRDFRITRFGGWPWERPDPVHGRGKTRFARYADGSEEHRN